MRVHLLGIPNTQTTAGYELDGFCTRTMLFADLLKRLGHTVFLYGVGENTAPCDYFIPILTTDEQKALLGGQPYQSVSFELHTPLAVMFNGKAANHIRSIKQPGDLICTIAGSGQQQIGEAHPELPFLEYSVGYQGVSARAHRVYQSAAWMHCVYGYTGVQGGRALDAVIPPWFPADEFPSATPDPYVLYCGRLVPSKGVWHACEAAKFAGLKLLVIGHGDPAVMTYGEYLGAVTTAERNELLSKATAVLMPTQYIEPFGNVAAEAQLCGTPVVSSDFGAFHESVEQGQTGYRCTSIGEYVQALKLAPALDRGYIRRRAQALYSTEAALVSYGQYFRRLQDPAGTNSFVEGLETAQRKGPYGSHVIDAGTAFATTPAAWPARLVQPDRTDERIPAAATA